MLAVERHHQILILAKHLGAVRVAQLAGDFGVAEETIRRDLDRLSNSGKLVRTHGGALDPRTGILEAPHAERTARQSDEKEKIGRAAAKLCQAGETVMLDASSSGLAMTNFLPGGLKIVTYSLAIVEKLAARNDLEIIQLGGTYEPRGRRFSGLLTENALRSLRLDRFFFSGGGLDLKLGISEPNPKQANLKALILSYSTWSCALMDHTKLNARCEWFFAKPDEFELLITDQRLPLGSTSFDSSVAP